MDENTIALVQNSFAKVVPIRDAAAELFYNDLFETAPEVKPYFEGSNMAEQGTKLMATLNVVVNGLRALGQIVPVAQKLAINHVEYGVKAEDYAKVGASLLRTLEKGLGDDFTPEVHKAWADTYAVLSDVMVSAAYGSGSAAAE